MTSRTGGTLEDPSMMTSGTGDTKKSSNVTPYKGHGKNLVTSYLFWKNPIHQRENTETNGSKPHYTESDNSYTDRSDDEKIIEGYELMDELSNKDREDAE